MISDLAVIGFALFLHAHVWYAISLLKKRNDVADVAWGFGFILVAWFAFFVSDYRGWRGGLSAILVTIWGARLARHIHLRNREKAEDARYQAWRKAWGRWFALRSYAQVFLLQGLLTLFIASPIVIANLQPANRVSAFDLAGLAVWLLGFLCEALADRQLASFLKEPSNAGKLMQSGLWRYSRHPNYFGEIAQWWGLWLMALSVPHGWLVLLGPLTITFLIVRVSGIPPLESGMRFHPEFEAYAKRTSPLIPWVPKK